MSVRDLDAVKSQIEDDLAAVLLCVWLNVLSDEGEPYERLCELIQKVIDEYETIDDYEAYRQITLDKTGISLKRTG